MQREQKAIDVHKGKIKLLVFVFCLIFSIGRSHGQSNETMFQRNFMRAFKYPSELKSACTATFANLLIEVSENGKITDVLVSESAPKLFVDQFNEIKGNLDLSLLTPVINSNKLKNCNIIIPIFYVYGADYCVNSFEESSYINDNYLNFRGKPLTKMSLNLKPIMVVMHKPMH